MLGNSYTLLIVSVGEEMTMLMRYRIFTVVGKTYLLLCGCDCLLSKRVSVFSLVILHLTRWMRHRLVVKLLFLSKRARPEIQPTITFLTMRVRDPDKDNWKKL